MHEGWWILIGYSAAIAPLTLKRTGNYLALVDYRTDVLGWHDLIMALISLDDHVTFGQIGCFGILKKLM